VKIKCLINNEQKTIEILPGEMLIDTLHKLNITSVRRGCDTTSCGVCTVLVDMKVVPSCSYLSARCDGKSILTVEGIAEEADKIAKHFGDEGADQCGYCNPSMALSVYALKQTNAELTDDQIRHELVHNLCRCTGYVAQNEAVRRYLEEDR